MASLETVYDKFSTSTPWRSRKVVFARKRYRAKHVAFTADGQGEGPKRVLIAAVD
jgi:hypothetical protein